MTVVYLDSVFALNGALDYFLLLTAAKLGGVSPRHGRCLAAALLGGLYAAGRYLPGWGFLSAAPVRCALCAAIALAAFGAEERLFRLTALFFAVSCLFAGWVLALELLIGPSRLPAVPDEKLLLGAAMGMYLLVTGLLQTAARLHGAGLLLPVRVCVFDRTVTLTALRDSGNGLRDGGGPVLVLASGSLDPILPPVLRDLLSPNRLRNPADLLEPLMKYAPELRPRLLPYHGVGVAAGLLLTVESQWVEIGGTRRPGVRLALSDSSLSADCQALWGGPVDDVERIRRGCGKGNRHGHSAQLPEPAHPSWPAVQGRFVLHRRQ